jgi:hypothetical protein
VCFHPLFKKFISFFKRFVINGVSITNQHLLIINGHNNHVTLKAKKLAQELGLDMIVLLTHMSYAL